MQGWQPLQDIELPEKVDEKDEQQIGQLFRKNSKKKGVYQL